MIVFLSGNLITLNKWNLKYFQRIENLIFFFLKDALSQFLLCLVTPHERENDNDTM